ncbi:MAG TPA: C-type lectin domain-containing protein [Kofleriaceae bacterium]
MLGVLATRIASYAARALAVVALFGCQELLDLEAPQRLAPDAAIDSPAPDARDDAFGERECPAAPAGCTLFRCAGSCHYSCTGTGDWNVAQSYCAQVGCLATIESQAEQDCITAATQPTNASPVWIGSTQSDMQPEPRDGWTWACGASSYANWGSYEPNDLYGNQDCAALSSGGRWDDISCANERRFVCEAP